MWLVIGFAAVKLFAHFLTVAVTPYGIHRDEFLYLSMGEHLRLWRMDFPPAIALLAKAARVCLAIRCSRSASSRQSPAPASWF